MSPNATRCGIWHITLQTKTEANQQMGGLKIAKSAISSPGYRVLAGIAAFD